MMAESIKDIKLNHLTERSLHPATNYELIGNRGKEAIKWFNFLLYAPKMPS